MAQIQHEQGQHCQTPNFGPGGAGSSKNLLGTWSKFLSLPFSQPHIEVCGFQKEKVLVPLNYIGTRRDSKWTSLFRRISMNTRNLGRYWEDFFQWTYCLYNPPPKKKNSPAVTARNSCAWRGCLWPSDRWSLRSVTFIDLGPKESGPSYRPNEGGMSFKVFLFV